MKAEKMTERDIYIQIYMYSVYIALEKIIKAALAPARKY